MVRNIPGHLMAPRKERNIDKCGNLLYVLSACEARISMWEMKPFVLSKQREYLHVGAQPSFCFCFLPETANSWMGEAIKHLASANTTLEAALPLCVTLYGLRYE